jgi:molybdate transport system ATP-binding protein
MLEVSLSKSYSGFASNIDATFDHPVTGIYGPSGSGKSSLLHMLAGLTRPDRGRIVLDGEVLFDHQRRIHLPPHRRRIGLVFQKSRLLPHISVLRNLKYGYRNTPRQDRRFDVSRIAGMLEIEHLLDRRPATLSGGESQRVALAMALLMSPKLLMMDEPLASLDCSSRENILPLLQRVRDETAIPMVLVSHQLEEILSLTDHLCLIRHGHVAGTGQFEQLVRQPHLLEILHQQGLTNVWPMQIERQNAASGLSFLRPARLMRTSPGQLPRDDVSIKAPLMADRPLHARVTVLLRPQDIALSLAPIEHISMQNQFYGTIKQIVHMQGQTLCVVDAGIEMLVEITHQTVKDLALTKGGHVWCLFKAQSIQLIGHARRHNEPTAAEQHETASDKAVTASGRSRQTSYAASGY